MRPSDRIQQIAVERTRRLHGEKAAVLVINPQLEDVMAYLDELYERGALHEHFGVEDHA